MAAFCGILLASILAFSFVEYSEGISCWVCYQARSNRDCLIRGFARRCNPNEGCENEVRYSGHRISITKRCKQMQACSTEQFQNSQLSNNRYQCGAGRRNSVCRCCCNSDSCNRDRLSCLEQGQPKCPFLFLPNGSTRCFGSADGISLRTRCRFSCRRGYQVQGVTSVSCIKSDSLAMWSGKLPRCRKMPTCTRIYSHSISNGFVRCSGFRGVATLGTSCVYRCNPRYFMVNANKRKTVSNYEKTVCTMEKSVAKWSRKPPNCVEEMCPVVTNFDHGIVTCSNLNRLGSVCEFSCLAGYDLIGSSSVKCIQRSGVKEWDIRPPICQPKPCPDETFKAPLLDVECTDFNRYGSVCNVKCKKGYFMTHPISRATVSTYTSSCVLKNRVVDWSSAPPACSPKSCNRVRVPRNGVVKCSAASRYLSRCSFSCPSPVHEIAGERSVICMDDGDPGKRNGVWSSEFPTCQFKKCRPIDADATDVHCNAGYVYKSTCTFLCKEGYFMLASDGITITRSKAATRTTCSLIDGDVDWSRAPPRCEQRRCHELVQPDKGSMKCTRNNALGSKCSFSCLDGFEMTGKSTLECKIGNRNRIVGKWSAPLPICKRRSCAQIYHDTIASDLRCTNEFKYESSCTLFCNNGYYMRESPPAEVIDRQKVTCRYSETGMTWSSRTVSCRPKTCDAFDNLQNGTIRCSEELIYTATCEFSCVRGFDLHGPRSVVCADDGLLSSKGRWSSPAPACEPKMCPPLLVNAKTTKADCTKDWDFTSKCTISCRPKNFMRDRNTGQVIRSMATSCEIDDEDNTFWEPRAISCEPVTCPAIDIPNAYVSCTNGNNTDSKCTFSCPVGYDLKGNVTNKCNAIGLYDARWKHPLPHCKVRTCPTLVTEEELSRECTLGTDYQSVCSFTCEAGMGLFMSEGNRGQKIVDSGVSTRRCNIDARGNMYWTGSLPKCNIKYCLVKRNPRGGRIKCTDGLKYQSQCTYQCNRGFRRVGPQTITCEEGKLHSPQGEWSSKTPTTCKRIARVRGGRRGRG